MARPKVNPSELQRVLDSGYTQADAAKFFGVSEAAISQRVQKLRIATSKVVALERAGELVDQKLDATARLQRVQLVIDEELAWAVAQAQSNPGPTAPNSRTPSLSSPPRSASSSGCSSISRGP